MTGFPALNALSLIDAHSIRHPERRAVRFAGRTITYGELREHSFHLMGALRVRGLGRGGRLCIIAANCPEHYLVYLAVLRCGATLFPINPDLTADEVNYILSTVDPTVIVCDSAMLNRVQAAAQSLDSQERITTFDELLSCAVQRTAPESVDPVIERSPEDMALVVHTSGTTARPKGVIATDAMEVRSAVALQTVWNIGPADISVCALPLSYTFGMFSASYAAFCAGACVLLLPKFHPVSVLEAIQAERATYMVGVPTMYAMMLEHIRQTGLQYDLSSVRMMAASGAPAAPQLKQDFEAATGIELRDYYALSECTPIFSFDLRRTDSPPHGSVGTLVEGAQVRIIDDVGREVATGQTGELLVRSERLTPGYYRAPERTAESMDAGWFKTRDLAWQDGDGHFFIVGRDRDQVISGGHKIASTEVESVVARMAAVAQVAVVGVPHPVMGEVVKAVVVLKADRACSAPEVIEFCAASLAAYKVPRLVEFRDTLPVSPAGKVLKRHLR
jgi:long-chain acyl-CoA synthetase